MPDHAISRQNWLMRNPDKWTPMEPEEPDARDPRDRDGRPANRHTTPAQAAAPHEYPA